jgi:hypothetical protein
VTDTGREEFMEDRGKSIVVLGLMCIGILLVSSWAAGDAASKPAQTSALVVEAGQLAPASSQPPFTPGVLCGYSVRNDTSPPLLDLVGGEAPRSSGASLKEVPLFLPSVEEEEKGGPRCEAAEGEEEKSLSPVPLGPMPPPITTFDGISNIDGYVPPDTNGDVGPDHYFQIVNASFQVFDKTGTAGAPAADIRTIWAGFGGVCETYDIVDPIVLYDEAADRWMVSGIPLVAGLPAPYHQCMAVSQTGDPLGGYYRYDFVVHPTKFNDYPKFGVWPVSFPGAARGAYFMTVNQFLLPGTFSSIGVYAFDREQMLQGLPATFLYYDYAVAPVARPDFFSALPADHDGAWVPPHDTPETVVSMFESNTSDFMVLVHFTPNFSAPGAVISFPFFLPVRNYDQLCPLTRNCIPQQGTAQRVDGLGQMSMYRAAYRYWGTYDSLVFNHALDLDPSPNTQAAIRWYEVRLPSTSFPYIYQQGTYSPDDHHRWLGSMAQDQQGDIALGFSISSSVLYPSIKYVGRLATDPLNTMPYSEGTIQDGTSYQTGTNRWGDYSGMTIDPKDGCTFWYTNEYYTRPGWNWSTKIGAFKFPECGGPIVINPPPEVKDGCDPGSADGRVDVEELINLFVPICSSTVTLFNVEGTLSSPDSLIEIGGFSPEVMQCSAPKTQTSVYGTVPFCSGPSVATARFTFRAKLGHSLTGSIPFQLDLRNHTGPLGSVLFSVPMDPIDPQIRTFVNPTPPDAGNIFLVDWDSPECPDGRGILFYWDEVPPCTYPGCPMSCLYDPDSWNLYRGDMDVLRTYGIFTHIAVPGAAGIGTCTAPCNLGRWDTSSFGLTHCQYLDCESDNDPGTFYFLLSGETDCTAAGEGAEGTLGFVPPERPYGGGTCP